MPLICGPGFTTEEESTEHTGLKNVYSGFLSEAGVVFRPNSLQAWERQLTSCCSLSSVCDTTAA